MADPIRRLGVISVERWDDLWRRNQYVAAHLVRSGAVDRLTFVGPPRGGFAARAERSVPEPGIEAVVAPLVVPRSWPGGSAMLARWVRRALADADALWINDPVVGAAALRPGIPVVYDVTDDWRAMPQPERDRQRMIAAEDVLARRARTVVCSTALADRWRERYGVEAAVVPNGVDVDAVRTATPQPLTGSAPHAVYVGTLHPSRIDGALLRELVAAWPGTVHLVGPNELGEAATRALRGAGAELTGAVPAAAVASWLVAADVLICPHLVDAFTLSLDAIKAHEYLATDRPVVATASSGFQGRVADGLTVAARDAFVSAALTAAGTEPFARDAAVDWAERAVTFARELRRAG